MDELANQQKLTAYMQIDSIWKKINKTPLWAKLVIVLLAVDIALTLHDSRVMEQKQQKHMLAKWVYKASIMAHKQDFEQMNSYINKVVAHDLYKNNSQHRKQVQEKYKKYGPQLLVHGFLARDIFIDHKEANEALKRWVELQTNDTSAAEKFADNQY